MMAKRPPFPLLVLLSCHALLALALIVVVPLGAAPDEVAHWEYVQFVAEHRELPVFRGEVPPAPGYEYHQPPLYYLACAPWWALLGTGAESYACRVMSLLFSLGTLCAVWSACRLLRPSQTALTVVATGLVALSPVQLGMAASTNNDSLSGLWCALLFYFVARMWSTGLGRRDLILMGLCMAAGLATKNTTLVVILAALGSLLHQVLRAAGKDFPAAARGFLIPVAVFLVAATPLALRNHVLYGDPLGLSAFSSAATAGTPGYPLFAANGITFFQYWRGMLLCIFATMWGFWGGPNSAVQALVPLNPAPVPIPIMLLMAGFAFFKIICLLGWLGQRRDEDRVDMDEGLMDEQPALATSSRNVLRWWTVGTLLVVAAWISFAHGHFSGGQARYLQPAILPVAFLLAYGWLGFWKGRLSAGGPTAILAGLLLVMSLANILVWKTLV